jgi:hypothetical protein
MKSFNTITVFITVISVTIFACKKEETELATSTPTINSLINPTDKFFEDNLSVAVQSHTVDVSGWTSILGNKGSLIWLNYGSFVDEDGNAVNGFIDIELIEALDNKDMLMLNRPTVTNNGELLISGGIIYINATQNGNQLQIGDPLQTDMLDVMGGNTSSPLSIWNGDSTTNGDFVWIEDTTNNTLTLLPNQVGYSFEMDTIGWTNLDVLADLGQGVTSNVSVVLPSSFNGANSAVMMYFTSMNSFMSISDGNLDGTFTPGAYYTIPIGATPKFVVISMINNNWSYYVSTNISITDPTNFTVPALIPAADEQDMQTAILNAL